MRWPSSWQDPSALTLLKGTSVNCLLVEKNVGLDRVAVQAKQNGIHIIDTKSAPGGVTVLPGLWPGLKLSRSDSADVATAAPTGAPWVDSNGWKIRLAATLQPGSAIWVDATPKEPRLSTGAYVVAVADAAAYGGRWIISLNSQLAAGIAAQNPAALETWKSVIRASDFFAGRKDWSDYVPEAVVGVVSDFSGANKFLSGELLNLLARTNAQYKIIPKTTVAAAAFHGLKALIYVDAEPPARDLQQQILAFVGEGGLLITGPKWGQVPGTAAQFDDHPRFSSRLLGKGRVAVGKSNLNDPFILANDSAVLISHRYDLLRFWNGGTMASHFTTSRDRSRGVLQMLFFATSQRGGPDTASVRVAGRYRTAKLWRLDQTAPVTIETVSEKDGLEVHLPPVSQYAAVEVEV
jgi:hypothetical protein